MPNRRKLEKIDYITTLLGVIIFLVFWLVVATFPNFFFFNPTGNSDVLRRFELVLSSIGWVLMSTGAPILLFFYSSGRHKFRNFLPIMALVWPISLIISQVTTYVQTGEFYFAYLRNFPIFIFTDIALPILIMAIWYDLREIAPQNLSS
jgi:hypothetical protein